MSIGRNSKEVYKGLLLLVVLYGFLAGCASGSAVTASREPTAQFRAQQIYEQLRGRTPPSEWSGGTASAFPEVPEGVVRPLEKLAASKTDAEEAAAMEELAEALEDIGYYSRVFFKSFPNGATIRYRPIARKRVVTAQVGWNSIAIGFYFVWAERAGVISSSVELYDIIAKRVKILVRERKADSSGY